MSWTSYLALTALFTVVLTVFYAVSYSVLMGVRDNYRRYAQRAEQQWTGPGRPAPRPRVPILWIVLAGVFSGWLVVHFLIVP